MNENTPKVYIACLASYNAGFLHGEWLDLSEIDDISESINSILVSSPIVGAEEWAVHDYESCGSLTEYPGLDVLVSVKIAYETAELESIEWELFCSYCENRGELISAEQIQSFQDAYAGVADSLENWCENFVEETAQLEGVAENLRHYFDFSRFAQDMEIDDVFTIRSGSNVHVFWNL